MKHPYLPMISVVVLATACASTQSQSWLYGRDYGQLFAEYETESVKLNEVPTTDRPNVFVCVTRDPLADHDWGSHPCYKFGEPHQLGMIDWERGPYHILVEVGSANSFALRYTDTERFGSIADTKLDEDLRSSAAIVTLAYGRGNAAEPIEQFVDYAGKRFAVLDLRLPGTWMTKEAEHGGLVEFFVPGYRPGYLTVQRVPLSASFDRCNATGPKLFHPLVQEALHSGACSGRTL